jgi:hypothetical protein
MTGRISLSSLGLSAYLVMGVLIGFGPSRSLSIVLLSVLIIYFLMRKIPRTWPSKIVLQIAFASLFLLLYFVGYGPEYRTESEISFSLFPYLVFSFYALLAMVLTHFSRTYQEAALFLLAITVGMLLHAAVVVGYTVSTLPPPYYGGVLSPFSGEIVNSPGYSNLAFFFPIAALAFLPLLKPRLVGLLFLAIGVSVSIAIGVLLAGRAFFAALAVALLVGGVLRLSGIKPFISMALVMVLGFALDAYLYEAQSLYRVGRDFVLWRFQEQGLESTRWEVYGIWAEQVLRDPWRRPVTPSLMGSRWFHNFWMDVYRDSGFLAFLFAVLIFALPAIALVKSGLILRLGSIDKVLLLLPVGAVFLTSIPMLGEKAAIFFYFAVSVFLIKYARISPLRAQQNKVLERFWGRTRVAHRINCARRSGA